MNGARAQVSLGKRLSFLLALQVFAGLVLVSGTVYLSIANHLDQRRERSFGEKRGAIYHLIAEAQPLGLVAELIHRLDDFLAGHEELALHIEDERGVVLYQNPPDQSALSDHRQMEFPVQSNGEGSDTLYATLSYNSRADNALLNQLALTLTLVSFLGALLVSRGVFWLVARGLRPVNDLAAQTRELNADSLGSKLDGSAQPTELQPLVMQFNALLERLSLSYEQLEGFNADVAHELNTPLTTLITSTELALRRPQDLDRLRELLGSNLEELQRMSGIIRDMLFLSRADRGGQARRSPVDSLQALAHEVVDYHEAALAEARIELVLSGDASGSVDSPLIKRALSNLLGNALRYANPDTVVELDIEQLPDTIVLSVINQGEPIQPTHQERLFDRFFRADPSRSMAEAHHGLGLSIVAGIARMHGGVPFVTSSVDGTRIGFSVLTKTPEPFVDDSEDLCVQADA